nr:NAD-dependent epimerase/dehydratase family protein [Mycolicibacterium fluoranthenivorans]
MVTGAAGFIGAFLCERLLVHTGHDVVGLDNLNHYYDVAIKHERLQMVTSADVTSNRFHFQEADLADAEALNAIFEQYRPEVVINLGAQAGVRYSVDSPRSYIDSNIVGFFNVLESCRHYPVRHLIYASSSSVYGRSGTVPYSLDHRTDSPVSLYAATKKANEVMAHAYSDLYGIPSTGLRFFTVYGPMGRPDMAYFKFTEKMVKREPIDIYNMGDLRRDFTYIADVVSSIASIIEGGPGTQDSGVSARIYNIGNSDPVSLLEFVSTLERVLFEEGVIEHAAERRLLPMQIGDVYETYADVTELERDYHFRPSTRLEDGLRRFAQWYKMYRRL